nr:peptidoglycan bridge formation glycyltransferase FemA/FemB family protein [Blastocatellia bacterium]
MVKWELLSATCNRAEWDQPLLQSEDYNVFQSFRWGEYKRSGGWTPMRWIARDQEGATIAMVQILVKTFPGNVRIGWAPGGPILRCAGTSRLGLTSTIDSLLTDLVALKGRTSIRFDSYLTEDAGVESALKQSSFVRPYFKINTGYSLMVDLLQPIAARRSQARPRHRSYIKKALDKNIEWKAGRDGPLAQELVSLHGEMMTQKKLSLSRIGIYEVSSLCDILEEQAVIFTGYLEGQAITSTLVLSFGRKAFYLIGASGKQGRALRPSYGLLDQLLGYLKAEGMAQFDFGGLDPLGLKAAGVDQFKTGFGGEMVKHLGEWEWATDGWLRWGFN